MARTTEMRLIELMVLKQDVLNVIEYLGKTGKFQFQSNKKSSSIESEEKSENIDAEFFDNLQKVRNFLGIDDRETGVLSCERATDEDRNTASKLISLVSDIEKRVSDKIDDIKRISDSYKEAQAFSNLQVPYSHLEHLSFISIKIGRIPKDNLEGLKNSVGKHAVIISLGDDSSRIMAVSSKKSRFMLDTELKKYGFVNMEIPEDFNGIPEELLKNIENEKNESEKALEKINEEKANFAETHKDEILKLLGSFSMGMQVRKIENGLESTSLVYRMTGWIPAADSRSFMKELDDLTEGRVAIREYLPLEVPSVLSGEEQVPVKLNHGRFVSAFERMI